jgi:ribosome-associated heat shock protein Hsp15
MTSDPTLLPQRLDKWLWCTRLAKSRTLAAKAILAGKVRVNGRRVLKPSSSVTFGDVITASFGRVMVVKVKGAVARRVAATLAVTLYEDLAPPVTSRPSEEGMLVHRGPRPTKRDRRKLDALQLPPES